MTERSNGMRIGVALALAAGVVAARPQVSGVRMEQPAGSRKVHVYYRLTGEEAYVTMAIETNAAGVFVCGACQAPKDIPESVAQASAAAGKVQVMFSHQEMTREPEIASINEQTCAACFACVRACPYQAIERAEIRDRNGHLLKRTARVNPGLCMGCGTCVAVCPSKSADLEGFSEQQIYAMVESLV